MLKKDCVRDGNRNIIASVTTGFSETSAIVRAAEPTSVFTPRAMYAATWSPSTPLTRVS